MDKLVAFLKDKKNELDTYTKAITKVHGQAHPEVFQVRQIYLTMQAKIDQGEAELDQEFEQLAQVTGHYDLPEDACQAFSKVYQDLKQADQLRQNTNKFNLKQNIDEG